MTTHSSERSIGGNLRAGYVYSAALGGASMQPAGLPAIERQQEKAGAHMMTLARNAPGHYGEPRRLAYII
jgi:hypothetical protein